MPFKPHVEHAWFVRLSGDLAYSEVHVLRRLIVLEGHLVVDCSGVTSAEPEAVGLLGDLHAEFGEMGYELLLFGLHGGLLREVQTRGFTCFSCGEATT